MSYLDLLESTITKSRLLVAEELASSNIVYWCQAYVEALLDWWNIKVPILGDTSEGHCRWRSNLYVIYERIIMRLLLLAEGVVFMSIWAWAYFNESATELNL